MVRRERVGRPEEECARDLATLGFDAYVDIRRRDRAAGARAR